MEDKKVVLDNDVSELKDIVISRGEPLKKGRPLKKKDAVIDALRLVFDPEMNIDVYNLGLIYDIAIEKNGDVKIIMTLTSPTCPMADEIPVWVAETVASLDRIGVVTVNVVWNPVWDLSKLSEEAKFQLEIAEFDSSFMNNPFNFD